MRNVKDLGWLAGVIEGEGHFRAHRGVGVCIEVGMTDEDVIRRCHEIAGVGAVYGPRWPNGRDYKPVWTWVVGFAPDSAGLLMTLYPFLGERRAARARELLVAWRQRPIHPKWANRRSTHRMNRASADK